MTYEEFPLRPAILLAGFLLTISLSAPLAGETLLIRGAKVYPSPSAEAIPSADILISQGRIASISPTGSKPQSSKSADREIEGSGLVAVAGFWNSHVHFTEPHWLGAAQQPPPKLEAQLREMLIQYGFTTVVDTGSAPGNTLALRKRIEDGLLGPEIHLYGGNFVAKGGSPAYLEVQLPELLSTEQARATATAVLDLGLDGLKIFTGSYLGEGQVAHIPLPLVQAVVETATARGVQVLSHPQSREGLETAIEGGVAVLTHTAPSSGPWSPELTRRMVTADLAVIPTLKLWRFELERAGRPPEVVDAFQRLGVEQLRTFAVAGGEVLFGTDVGYMDDYDPREEYQRLHEAGLDFRQILASLTTAPASRFRGNPAAASILEPGQPADLVLLAEDPAQTPEAFANVRTTIRGGRVLFQTP